MFGKTKNKLEECHSLLDQLGKGTNSVLFRSLFNSFINSSRAVTNALQKDGKKIPGFSDWYEGKQNEMREDELLRFLHEARTEDFHEGKHRLAFRMAITEVHTEDFSNPPSLNSKLIISGEGPFWIENPGTPRERRIPAIGKGGYRLDVFLQNPPNTHLGNPIEKKDPLTICKLADSYFTSLVCEALERFDKTRS